jgi:hypothetical protein
MNGTLIVAIVVAVIIVIAAAKVIYDWKKGKHCDYCGGCSGKCEECDAASKPNVTIDMGDGNECCKKKE